MKELQIKKLTSTAVIPKRVTPGSAGLDLVCDKRIIISTGTTGLVDTGLSVAIPEGYVGIIKIKSGYAKEYNVTENAGVIDCDYRGPLKVAIANTSDTPLRVEKGDAIAQLLILPCWMGKIEIVEELTTTIRGEKGFGEASKSS